MKYLKEFNENYDLKYPIAGEFVDGREVLSKVDNISSISASLDNYEILPHIREISMNNFDAENSLYKNQKEIQRCKILSEQIKESNSITPLIVVEDNEGLYILEGAHRFDALYYLNAKSFPALVVIDLDNS
jgi:recombinational DNA repair protein RecR